MASEPRTEAGRKLVADYGAGSGRPTPLGMFTRVLAIEAEAAPIEAARLVSEAQGIAKIVSEHIDKFRLDLAADTIYHFVWDRFAAEIIEQSKSILKNEDSAAKASRAQALHEILFVSLKLLHPFMPFVTEAIWQNMPKKECDQLMVAKWPLLR